MPVYAKSLWDKAPPKVFSTRFFPFAPVLYIPGEFSRHNEAYWAKREQALVFPVIFHYNEERFK